MARLVTRKIERARAVSRCIIAAGAVCLAMSWGAVPGSALAGTEADAEAVRLDEDLRKLASRNAWEGVEGIYARLRGLEAKGVQLSAAQHELGAEAALQLGRMREARGRFGLARAATSEPGEKQRLQGVIEDIDARFGSVALTAAGKARRDAKVQMGAPVFALDARTSIQHANDQLQLSGSFEGLLPVGEYTFGAATFVVTTDGGVTRAEASAAAAPPKKQPEPTAEKAPKEPKEPKEPKARPERPPRDGGPAMYAGLGVGSATWVSRSEATGYYVPGGTGLAARIGAGIQVPTGPVAVLAELSWDGMFGSGGEKAAVHLGALGAGLAFGSTVQGRILGQVAAGRASVVGVDAAAACRTEEWQMEATTGDLACEDSAHWAGTGVDYLVLSPGLIVGGAVSPAALAGVSFTLDVGLRSMGGQVVPWTALGARTTFGGGGAP